MIINYSAVIKGCGCYDASFLRVIMEKLRNYLSARASAHGVAGGESAAH